MRCCVTGTILYRKELSAANTFYILRACWPRAEALNCSPMSLKETNRFDRATDSAPQEVEYPALFHFRIIAELQAFVEADLVALLAAYKVAAPLSASRASSAGRYHACSVSVEIRSRVELHDFDAALKRVPGVRMVL